MLVAALSDRAGQFRLSATMDVTLKRLAMEQAGEVTLSRSRDRIQLGVDTTCILLFRDFICNCRDTIAHANNS